MVIKTCEICGRVHSEGKCIEKECKMNLNDVRREAEQKAYETKLPYPTSKKKITKEMQHEALRIYKDDVWHLQAKFVKDLTEACIYEGATKNAADLIADQAWADGHSEGYLRIVDIAEGLLTIAKAMKG